ncbi:MAG TPA: hypothetical protein VL173_13330 [Vicinamibacterales bacterium]|nr:hypothetical protein [Vicinamibacterales bacterium]
MTVPLLAGPQSSSQPGADNRITLRGCVQPGLESGTVLMNNVTEVPTGGRSAVPEEAHGRKVIFWLDKDDPLKPHVGHMVEVTGARGGVEKSEIELKQGHQKSGGVVVEFEGPGRDVKASSSAVGGALGTSGRTGPEKDDIKTFLYKVKVDNVRGLPGTCQ